MGKAIEVMLRTADEMAAVAHANPFDEAARQQRVVAIFLDEPPPERFAGDAS